MKLELSAEERDLLVRLLEREVGDLRVEVRRTGRPALRDELKREEALIRDLAERLQGPDDS